MLPPTEANYVFVTSSSHAPSDLDVATADATCNARAAAAGLPGAYVAWFSATGNNARDRIGAARGWVRLDGLPFADTLDDLRNGKIFYPAALDETCSAVEGEAEIWTGTDITGNASDDTCTDWTGAGTGRWGHARGTTRAFTYDSNSPCIKAKHLLCFGVDRTTAVAPTPVTGRRAFLSSGWAPTSGLSGADAKCQSDADAAALGGTFHALLATSTTSAASRFSESGPNWVRLDGVPLAASPADLFAARFDTTLTQRAPGTYDPPGYELAWVGAIDPTSVGGATCDDWTAETGRGLNTDVLLAGSDAFSGGEGDCTFSHALYCLEE